LVTIVLKEVKILLLLQQVITSISLELQVLTLKSSVLLEQHAQLLAQLPLRLVQPPVHKVSTALLVQQHQLIVQQELGLITWICLMLLNVLNVLLDSHVQQVQHQLIGQHVQLINIVLKDHLREFHVLVLQILVELLVYEEFKNV